MLSNFFNLASKVTEFLKYESFFYVAKGSRCFSFGKTYVLAILLAFSYEPGKLAGLASNWTNFLF